MSRITLEKAKEIIAKYISDGKEGMYYYKNPEDPEGDLLYDSLELQIYINHDYNYFEVLGLTYREAVELGRFYEDLLTGEEQEEED